MTWRHLEPVAHVQVVIARGAAGTSSREGLEFLSEPSVRLVKLTLYSAPTLLHPYLQKFLNQILAHRWLIRRRVRGSCRN
jgi:hypothetical protein